MTNVFGFVDLEEIGSFNQSPGVPKMGMLRATLATFAALLGITSVEVANAQAPAGSNPPPIRIETITGIATEGTITAVDLTRRVVTVKTSEGKIVSGTVHPSVGGLDLVKPGDQVRAKFEQKLTFSVVPSNIRMSPDRIDAAIVTSQNSELPAGVAAVEGTITWLVVAVSPSDNTITLVSPAGGQMHTYDVVSSQGRAELGRIKLGDKLTITFASYVFGAVVRKP